MMVIVLNDDRKSIRASLYFYDASGTQLGEEVIPVGGTEITELPGAVAFKFVAEGFKDAVITDLYEYESLTMEMIPRFRWVVPAAIAAFAVLILGRSIKL